MPKRIYQKPLKIDLDFEEALERFIMTDPDELPDDAKPRRKRAPKRPAKGKKQDAEE